MNRIHIHIRVGDLAASRRFYSAMFGQEPTVSKPDYAKWSLAEPSVNLAISSTSSGSPGVDHVGIQAESDEDLAMLQKRLNDASFATVAQPEAQCCYVESDKHWAADPDGLTWEMFHTMGEIAVYGEDRAQLPAPAEKAETAAPATGSCCD